MAQNTLTATPNDAGLLGMLSSTCFSSNIPAHPALRQTGSSQNQLLICARDGEWALVVRLLPDMDRYSRKTLCEFMLAQLE